MYSIAYSRSAIKTLRGLPANTRALLVSKIEALSADPFGAANVKQLKGRPGYRLRVGDWRVIFEVDAGVLVIHVLDVGARGSIY